LGAWYVEETYVAAAAVLATGAVPVLAPIRAVIIATPSNILTSFFIAASLYLCTGLDVVISTAGKGRWLHRCANMSLRIRSLSQIYRR
jgi:hypothetical protein